MRYMIEQKALSLADRFFIKDESGQVVYEATGKTFSLGAKVSLKSPDGQERAFIRQKWAFTPTFQLLIGGELAGTLKRVVFSWSRRYKLQLPGGAAIEARDVSWGHEYELLLDGAPIGRVSRKWFSWRDTYGVEINDESKALLILTMVVALDLSFASEQSSFAYTVPT